MAYYRVDPREIPPPPEPPIADDASVQQKADARKEHERVLKVTKQANATREKAVGDWVAVVVDERTGKDVCLCEGPAHAEYIASLLNDRPPR